MSDFNRGLSGPAAIPADMSVDAGLRSFMLGVYNKVGLGLVISAALAWVTGNYPPARDMLFQQVMTQHGLSETYTILGWIVALAPLPVLLIGRMAVKQTPATSGIVYWAVVALFGASLGSLTLLYTGASIFQTLLISAGAFGALSLVGYTTKRDLTAMGSFLIMGVFGLMAAMLVNFFIASSVLYMAINVLGVLIFAGLIAYDTQRLKMTYYQMGGDTAALGVATNYGALSLYLDFLNLFLFLLRLFGSRR
jgi:hypothetical protein